MSFKVISAVTLVVLCDVLSIDASPAASYTKSITDRNLLNFMTKALSGGTSAAGSIECFNYYMPLLSEIASTFEKNYEACLSTAKNETDALIQKSSDNRDNITETSNQVCERFSVCQAESSVLNFYDCYSNLGGESARIYTISQDASVHAADYRESYRIIQIESEKCTKETQRAYVTDTANAYQNLDDCLDKGLNILTTSSAPASSEEPTTS